MIGTFLGPYKIIEQLGAGGMGEVYLAEDSKLERRVALKVLPLEGGDDEERRQRFQREAKAIAALNHPNIVVIHSVENEDGVDFITMELIDGELLNELIPPTGMVLDRFLNLSQQLVDAVAAAHAQGITHRDLKPSNVMVTKDGRVKVLDFGLAKLKALVDGTSAATTIPHDEITGKGQILGTVSYMSPEQAEGKPVDERSDLFSLGILLYQMATGERPFKGDTAISVMSSIIKETPQPVWERNAELPRHLGRIIRRLLEKSPNRRYQTARDLKVELEGVESDVASGIAFAGAPAAAVPPARARLGGVNATRAAALLLTAVVAAALTWWLKPAPAPTVARVVRFDIPLTAEDRFFPFSRPLAISPDGSLVAYTSGARLFVRALDGGDPRLLAEHINANAPIFSPDGEWVLYQTGDGVWRVSIHQAEGVPPILLSRDGFFARGGSDWAADGRVYFSSRNSIVALDPNDGSTVFVISEDPDRTFWGPSLLPDGRSLLFSQSVQGRPPQVVVRSLETGEERVLGEGEEPRYVSSGHLVYTVRGVLMAHAIDADIREFAGDAVPVLPAVNYVPLNRATQFAVSDRGDVVYLDRFANTGARTLTWVEMDGTTTPASQTTAFFRLPRLSPDGRHVALLIKNQDASDDVWTVELRRDVQSRITTGADSHTALWTPDGNDLIYATFDPDSTATGPAVQGVAELNMHRQPADLIRPPERLLDERYWEWPGDITSDGEYLIYGQLDAQSRSWSIRRLALADSSTSAVVEEPGSNARDPVLSPGGRWLAFDSDRSGQQEVYAQRVADGGGRVRISPAGGSDPTFSPDGSTIYYLEGRRMMAVDVGTGTSLDPGTPRALFEVPTLAMDEVDRNYDIDPSGERFLMVTLGAGTGPDAVPRIHVVLNWFEELRELLPGGR